MAEKSLDQQAKEILKIAEERGVQSNFFFVTTFNRYLTQIKILNELKKSFDKDGALVTKEYVKGRQNLYTNPAVTEYNRTTDSANKTVTTLLNVLKGFGQQDDKGNEEDPLLKIINGGV
jgi:hypothetical protein